MMSFFLSTFLSSPSLLLHYFSWLEGLLRFTLFHSFMLLCKDKSQCSHSFIKNCQSSIQQNIFSVCKANSTYLEMKLLLLISFISCFSSCHSVCPIFPRKMAHQSFVPLKGISPAVLVLKCQNVTAVQQWQHYHLTGLAIYRQCHHETKYTSTFSKQEHLTTVCNQ